MSVRANLIKAKALIDTPEKWARGQLRTNSGCLCALGAIGMVVGGEPFRFDGPEKEALFMALPDGYDAVSNFNDERSHEDVMWLFSRAIEASE
jgi:hypothetical protein